MPEIKHTFTGGKMNKDLDDRLVPKDQYRDAMNIQVSTSEGSDVGTIQNILGNKAIELPIVETWGSEDQKYDCVGSLSDESNESSYWFLSGETRLFNNVVPFVNIPDFQYEDYITRDYIIKRSFNTISKAYEQQVVFTDWKKFYFKTVTGSDFGGTRPIEGGPAGKLRIPWEFIEKISVGDTLTGIYYGGNFTYLQSKVIYVNAVGPAAPENYIIVDVLPQLMWFIPSDSSPYILEFTGNCLQFESNNLITSINIIDDLLFWTDGMHEPKVINTPRSIAGTDQTGVVQTKLINPTLSALPLRNVLQHDIHVIKRKPTKKLTVEYSRNNRSGFTKGTTNYNFNTAYNLFAPGYQGEIIISTTTGNIEDVLNYNIGDILLLLNSGAIESGDRTLPYEYDVKLVIEDIDIAANGDSLIKYKIISISSLTPADLSTFSVSLDERSFEKFENEMLRFSYRYRYLDKEVSAFAPFTDLIFQATKFHYTKDTAYNIGMANTITDVIIKDFVDIDKTLSVESIDLLVKFEGSPLVYIIDTIKRNQFVIESSYDRAFDGEYSFNPKNIKGVLPENQMLRPWDAVPLSAKSQEVIGNRIVYGNYISSYDFEASDYQLDISNSTRYLSEYLEPLVGVPSVKSKRNYQLGIVLLDENGRESPIFTNSDSSVEISKADSKNNMAFVIENNCSLPAWVKSYKYYVKDFSLPSYNIVVDAFYKAENGDFWIAVPSSERNKVQEGDFLELKKGINSDDAVEVKMNTKAISIKNEVPEFIGTTWRTLGKQKAWHYDVQGTTVLHELFSSTDHIPQVGATGFRMNKGHWKRRYSYVTGYGGGTHLDAEGLVDLAVRFSTIQDPLSSTVVPLQTSEYYNCGRVAVDKVGVETYHVTLNEPIREQDDWIADTPTSVASNIVVEFFEKVRLPRPQFQGKFFIKIEAKENLQQQIAPTSLVNNITETQLHEFSVRNIAEYLGGNMSLGSIANGTHTIDNDVNGVSTGLTGSTTTMNTYQKWKDVFSPSGAAGFGSSTANGQTVPTFWFVDRLQYYRQRKEKVWDGNNEIWVESAPDNTWDTAYSPIMDHSKRHGLGVFLSDTQHVTVDAEAEAQMNDGNRLPYYVYQTPAVNSVNGDYMLIGSPSDFVNNEGGYFMELSLLGLFEEIDITHKSFNCNYSPCFHVGGNITQSHWSVNKKAEGTSSWPYGSNVTVDASSENQKTLDFLQTLDQKFKFEGGTEIFTIKSCRLEWRYNYADGQDALNEQLKKEQGTSYDQSKIDEFIDPLNRRLTAIIRVDKNPLAYTDPSGNIIDITDVTRVNTLASLKIIFLEQELYQGGNVGLSTANPAVFEAEKIEEEKLDIYYEASDEIPIHLNIETLKRFIPSGSKVVYPKDPSFLDGVTVLQHRAVQGTYGSSCIVLKNSPMGVASNVRFQQMVTDEDKLLFITPNGNNIYLKLTQAEVATLFAFDTRIWVSSTTIGEDCSVSLSWYNCFSFGNGVESAYLKDSFNKQFINKGVKVSSSLQGEYKQEQKPNGLIYSGLYNENSETNNLNQFIMAEKITKEINPTYGSIQKLHARSTADGDLIALCEDRILKILAEKDAVFNADGNPQLVATENVLGQAIPYSGEYGISTNPESFASESYRCYFTDKVRGVVLRLSKDGLTPISDFGMKDWFRDHLKLSKRLIGSYDSYKKEYNITLNQHPELITGDEGLGTSLFTLSFKENVKGWVSFKSFASMQDGLSCANDYYTYYNNHVWLHNSEDVDRNTFYNVFRPSYVDVILNDNPGIVKTFHTLNYEGSQGRYGEEASYDTYLAGTNVVNGTYASPNFKDLYYHLGWLVEHLYTDKERGQVRSFVEKEGKWFNYIHGRAGGTGVVADAARTSGSGGQVTGYFDNADINFQGLGTIQTTPVVGVVYGCTDPDAFNYNSSAAYDDPSNPCIAVIYGCMDSSASNYDANANTDDGSCIHPGCTDCGLYWESITGITCLTQTGTAAFDAGSINFDPNANTDDSSCIAVVLGCTDPAAFNYNSSAHMDDGSCISVVNGCTDPTQFNYDALANTDDGSCIPFIYGCTTSTALNYNASANTDDGSCNNVACNDSGAFNYNANSTADTDCLYCPNVSNVQVSHAFINNNSTGNTSLYVSWDAPTVSNAIYTYGVAYAAVAADGSVGTFTDLDNTVGATNWTIDGLDDNTEYMIVIQSLCWDGVGTPTLADGNSGNYIFTTSTFGDAGAGYNIPELIEGCTTSGSFNYDSSANFDDGSCTAIVNGCTDPAAFNYDSLANTDDGSCIAVVNGCTDATNLAYNPNANTDDGSCLTYAVGAVAGDANDDGTVDLADLTLVINNWLQSTYLPDGSPGNQPGDTNGDGVVDLADLTAVINHWLQTGITEFTSNGGWDGLVLEQINMTKNELVTDSEFNNANAWTTPPTGNDPYGNFNYASASQVNLNNSGLALIVAGGPLQSTWYWWSVHQNVGFVAGNTYEVSFRARQVNGSGNLQLSQGYNIFFDQAITSTFADYTVSFTAVNDNPSSTDILAIGGAASMDVFEIEYISTGTNPLPNHNCYRLYATFDLTNTNYTNHELLQVFADEISPSMVLADADFYNYSFMGAFPSQQHLVNPGFWNDPTSQYYAPESEFDTWISLGDSYTSDPSHVGDIGVGSDLVSNGWSFGGVANSDTALFRMPGDPLSLPDADGRILLGQFNTTGTITNISMNFRGKFKDANGNTKYWQKRNVSSYTTINL